MSNNLRALPNRQIDRSEVEDAAERAVEAIRLLIRHELAVIEQERATPEAEDNEELTVEEVAQIKKVKPRTVYEWVRNNAIKFHKTPTGRLRFYRSDVES